MYKYKTISFWYNDIRGGFVCDYLGYDKTYKTEQGIKRAITRALNE